MSYWIEKCLFFLKKLKGMKSSLLALSHHHWWDNLNYIMVKNILAYLLQWISQYVGSYSEPRGIDTLHCSRICSSFLAPMAKVKVGMDNEYAYTHNTIITKKLALYCALEGLKLEIRNIVYKKSHLSSMECTAQTKPRFWKIPSLP